LYRLSSVVLRDGVAHFLVLQLLEEGERALAADARLAQEGCASLVGAGFLGADERVEFAGRRMTPRGHYARRRLAAAQCHGRRSEQEREQHHLRGYRRALLEADDVPAGDVAQFVRDHALDFVRVVGGFDKSRVQVDDLPARHEGIDRAVADHHHLDVVGPKPCRLDERARHVHQQLLRLGIAKDRLRRRRLHRHCEAQGEQHDQPGDKGRRRAGLGQGFGHDLPIPSGS
jgi:hypothetical protein